MQRSKKVPFYNFVVYTQIQDMFCFYKRWYIFNPALNKFKVIFMLINKKNYTILAVFSICVLLLSCNNNKLRSKEMYSASTSPTLLTLVDYKHPLLRKKITSVKFPLDKQDQQIINNMRYSIQKEQLQKATGKKEAAGMAANQWGIDRRIFLFCPTGDTANDLQVIINPSYEPITETGIVSTKVPTDLNWEGCFSVPLTVGKVERYKYIKVKYQDESGKTITKQLNGWDARVWQHENDHLDGILYDDQKINKCKEKHTFTNEKDLEQFYSDVKKKAQEEKLTSNCHCGSKKQYKDCCGLYLVKQELPSAPEQLMRSRYSAYVEKNLDYIKKTMQDPALSKFINTERANMAFAKDNLEWLGLTVVKSYYDSKNNDIGYVEFIAKYKSNSVENVIHELSKFYRKDGRWYYVDGEIFVPSKG